MFASDASSDAVSNDSVVPQRLIVLTDIEADPDDTESLVRLLLYSDVINLEGLIATTSTYQREMVAPDSIRAVVRAYGRVRGNLLKHDANYPDADILQTLITQGLAVYGMQGVGQGKDSPGSDLIISALEKNDSRPLWVSVWGGANTLAQALYKLRSTHQPEELSHLLTKLRVYAISDQDDSGSWIRKNFPNLFYIVSPGGYGAATWGGMNFAEPGNDNTTVSNRWIAENIQQGHGPLGAVYPDVAYGMEGDTPSWLSLIPNGLNAPEHPNWGGWGGRYELYIPKITDEEPNGFDGNVPIEPETHPIWTNAVDTYFPSVHGESGRATHVGEKSFKNFRVTIWRWRDDFQNDFAARIAWCTKAYRGANHPPVPKLNHADALTVKSGEKFHLDARPSNDPDGDSLSFYWFEYAEAGSYHERIPFDGAENLSRVTLVAPKVNKSETVHFILRLTDKGSPALSRYKRVIVTITP
jgi:hypothetical protein